MQLSDLSKIVEYLDFQADMANDEAAYYSTLVNGGIMSSAEAKESLGLER